MKLDHIAIKVENIQRSIEWYTNKFKAEVLYCDDTWAMVKIGDTKLAFVLPSQHPPHFGLSVESVEDIPSNIMKIHRDLSIYSYIKDPDGNVVEVLCYKKE